MADNHRITRMRVLEILREVKNGRTPVKEAPGVGVKGTDLYDFLGTDLTPEEFKAQLDYLEETGKIAGRGPMMPDQAESSEKLRFSFYSITAAGTDEVERSKGNDFSIVPTTLAESLTKFRNEHPAPNHTGFLMMRFGKTVLHDQIFQAVRNGVQALGLTVLRADDKQYHDELFDNIQTYMHGCGFGIAIFERIEQEDFNPNVSLEVGYMIGLGKPVLLLKDRTLKTLQTDLIGRLYRVFDPHDPVTTIPLEIERWLRDKEIISL